MRRVWKLKRKGYLQSEYSAREIYSVSINCTCPDFGFQGTTRLKILECIHVQSDPIEKPGVLVELAWMPEMDINSEYTYTDDLENKYKAKVVKSVPSRRGEICQRIQERRGRELPGFLSFPVFTSVMSEYVDLWEKPIRLFHEQLIQGFKTASRHYIDIVSKDWPRLGEKIGLAVHAHLRELELATTERLNKFLELEKLSCSENHYFMDTVNKIRNDRLLEKFRAMSVQDGAFISIEDASKLLNRTWVIAATSRKPSRT